MQLIDVAAGLVFRSGKLLITQRRPDDHLGGLWEFPGGKRECGESFEECLRRELREELGIEVEVGPLIETVEHHYPEKSVRLLFHQCRLNSGEPRALACNAIEWVTREQLAQYAFPAADERLLLHLQQTSTLWE